MSANARRCLVFLAACALAACGPLPTTPSARQFADAESIVAQMAVAFLNRFSTTSVSPAACLVDFTDACRGKRDELADIENNRAYFQILGARLGTPTIRIAGSGAGADIAVPCAFDSRNTKCETPDCVPGSIGYVAGTCLLTAVREASGWRLCTSNFAGAVVSPSAQQFFGNLPKNPTF